MSAKKRKGENSQELLKKSISKLDDRYRAIEEDLEEKVLDPEHRELLDLLSNLHTAELRAAGSKEHTSALETIIEEQGTWLREGYQFNINLLEVVRVQHEIITRNSLQISPELEKLYRQLQEKSIEKYSVLPRINSAVSSVDLEEEEEEEETQPPLQPTPVFMKTYNVDDKYSREGAGPYKLERDVSQTTIHVLSTPSLTGGRESAPSSPKQHSVGAVDSTTSLVIKGSPSDLTIFSPAPGKQAKKAIQLQRLRTLRTEPAVTAKQKGRNKNIINKTYSKHNAFVKSDTHLKLAEKAKIYGNTRTPQSQSRSKKPPVRRTNNNNQLTGNGANNFSVKVFR